METLLVRAGESLPHKQALSVISGCPPGARAAEQGPSHVWHRGLAKAARCQARRQGDVGLNERLCNVTCGAAAPGHRLQQAKGQHGAAHTVLPTRCLLPAITHGLQASDEGTGTGLGRLQLPMAGTRSPSAVVCDAVWLYWFYFMLYFISETC